MILAASDNKLSHDSRQAATDLVSPRQREKKKQGRNT
jgi:hypothetical protein